MKKNKYADLEKQVGVKFADRQLLDRAFVHRSYLNEHKEPGLVSNERLEFLGDAVLELVTTEFLFTTFADMGEGELTNYRAALVKGRHLAEVAKQLELGRYLHLSNGEERSGGREKNYILANTVESLIGAIYLDQGFETAHRFIDTHILVNLGTIIKKGLHLDAKTQFQEMAQEHFNSTPVYRVQSEDGPDHSRVFTMTAFIGDEKIASGKGTSKQKAEQSAALAALKVKGWYKG